MSDNITNLNLSISVDDGSRRVPIKNTLGEEIGCFTFRPTDIGIVERFNRMASQFDAITKPLEALDDGVVDLDDPKYAEALKEAETRLFAAVDELLGGDVAGAFFGSMHPFSPVNGEFYCTQVLNILGQFIGQQFDHETASFSAKAKKYARRPAPPRKG